MTNTISKVIRNGTEYEFQGKVSSVNGNTGAVTVNDVKVAATAPASPTEGMTWYDTTNDVLKTYNGSNWSEISGNTKTFYLSGTSDLTTAQAAYDWYLAGRNPIISYLNTNYILGGTSSDANGDYVIFYDIIGGKVDGGSFSYSSLPKFVFKVNNTTVLETSIQVISTSPYVLATGVDYTTPYTPEYNGSPATKKYVDDNAGIQNDTTGTTTTVTKIRAGTEAEYALITPNANTIYHIY